MKEIQLTQNKVALIDDEDYALVNQYKWYTHKDKYTWYARHNLYVEGKPTALLMHRLILNAAKGLEIDHIDRYGLNNQKENLRISTRTENARNRTKQKNNTSGYKGVYWHKTVQKWTANIVHHKNHIHLGVFSTIEEAVLAYNTAAISLFGEFAYLNIIKGEVEMNG
jgi:hypothetical protein